MGNVHLKEYLIRIEKLLETKDLERAKKEVLELAKNYPEDPEARFSCGSIFDSLGLEREAVFHYEKALENGIADDRRERTYIQLGSSYRSIGEYKKAKEVLMNGLKEFPENHAMKVFLAMTLYNLGDYQGAVSELLNTLAETTGSQWIKDYKRAIQYYACHLDEKWQNKG